MNWLLWLSIIRWMIRIGMIPVILRRRFTPSTAIAWLAVIFLVPVVGLFLYLLIGTQVLGRRRRSRYRRLVRDVGPQSHGRRFARQDGQQPHHRDRQDPVVAQTERAFGMPSTEGNDVQFIGEHDKYFASILEDIEAAKHHVHLLYYIFAPDETGCTVAEALRAAASRGVACRVLVDAAGSRPFFKRRGLAAELSAAGVAVRAALPVSLFRRGLARIDLRNHRKLIVVDGAIGYTGSHNIINSEYPLKPPITCHDLSARYLGPVVGQLQAVFAEDWTFDTDEPLPGEELFPYGLPSPSGGTQVQTVPSGPEAETQTLRRILLTAIAAARTRLVITSPYFVPDEHTILALSMAAHRGVEVHVVVSKRTDYGVVNAAGRSYYGPLMEYGVRMHSFPRGMLHAKTLTIDDNFAMIGSANIDSRSFILNFELNTLLYGPEVTNRLLAIQESYIRQCQELDLASWRARPLWRQYVDSAAALLSPIL